MRLITPIQRRQRHLVDPQPLLLIFRYQPQSRAQVEQYIRRLAQQERFAGLARAGDAQGGRGEGRWVAVCVAGGVVEGGLYGGGAGGEGVGDVGVGGLGCFEGEADVFAAAGDVGVVEEFVGGGGALGFGGGGGHGQGAGGDGGFLGMGEGVEVEVEGLGEVRSGVCRGQGGRMAYERDCCAGWSLEDWSSNREEDHVFVSCKRVRVLSEYLTIGNG